jgi:hypothetical protein
MQLEPRRNLFCQPALDRHRVAGGLQRLSPVSGFR